MRTLVHLSDLHFGRVDRRLIDALADAIVAAAPHLVAVSGDLTQRARRGQFAEARAFLERLPFPKIVVPGNHDVPLYNIAARAFFPLRGYTQHITDDLEPVFQDDDVVVAGLNSTRAVPFSGRGRLSVEQVDRAASILASAPASAVKIVVTHHPFDLPAGHGEHHLIGRSRMAMARLAAAGADLFLAGHLHVSHVGATAQRYPIAGHSALVVQAGTLSTRTRGELNSFNVLRVDRPRIAIERHSWNDARGAFALAWSGAYEHTSDGWNPA